MNLTIDGQPVAVASRHDDLRRREAGRHRHSRACATIRRCSRSASAACVWWMSEGVCWPRVACGRARRG